MTREDAAREIDNTACCFSDKRFRDAMHMAAAALCGPQPDPDTGLMPCGCGGVPVPYSWDETLFSGDTPCLDVTVACQKCGMGGNIWHESKLDAKNWWNAAMGWRMEG